MNLKLKHQERKRLWIEGQVCNPQFSSIFQNEYEITDKMIDEELKLIKNHQRYIDQYTEKVKALKSRT